jgi:hypothetical protein
MQIPFLQWVFQTIPECLALASLVVVLAERKLEMKKILFVGMGQAVVVYGVRLLPLTFGVHTIIFIIALAVFLHMATKANLSKCLLFALIAEIVLIVAEMAALGVMVYVIGLDLENILSNLFLKIIVGWPQIVIVLLIALGINKRLNKTNSLSELS